MSERKKKLAGDLQIVQHSISSGDIESAVNIAKARDTRSIINTELHLSWANTLEELGLPEEAALELNLAIRDSPERIETYHQLSDLLLDFGRPDKAAHIWAALVKNRPDDPDCYEALGEALRETKEYERAKKIYELALEKTQDPRFKGLLREISFVAAEFDQDENPAEKALNDVDHIIPKQHQLVRFASLFKSREGIYARQWLSPTGESGYTPVEESMSLKVIENHILGNYTIGAYPVRLDNTAGYIALDVDIAKFAVSKAITSKTAWNGVITKTHQTACKILDVASAHGVTAYIEDSGFKGRHVWIFLETAIPAGVTKKFGESILTLVDGIPPEVTVEVFPKQGSVRKGGLGNLIKLPLGFHKRTGKRGVFVEPNDNLYPDQLSFLENIKLTPRRAIYAFIQRIHGGLQPVPDQVENTSDVPWEAPEPTTPLPVMRKPEIEYHLDADPQFQTLMLKCAALKSLVEKINRTGALDRDETQVLIHTLGHLEQGDQAVNQLFRQCTNTDPALFLKSRLKGNPMSCPKLKSRLPEMVRGIACNCVFGENINLYPNPLNHLHDLPRTGGVAPLGITVDTLQFQNLLVDYIRLRKQLRETMTLLGQYEQRLETFFAEAGVDFMETPSGKVSIEKNTGVVAFKLEL